MNKSELIDSIAQHANLTKADAGKALDGLIHSIEATLKLGNSVALVGFGTFELKHRGERKGRNPQTGADRAEFQAGQGIERRGQRIKARERKMATPFELLKAKL